MSRNTGVANFDVSASGDLASIPGNCEGGARTLVWVDRDGKADPLPLAPKSYLHPRLSPDERRLAIEVEGTNHNLYCFTISTAAFSPTSPPTGSATGRSDRLMERNSAFAPAPWDAR